MRSCSLGWASLSAVTVIRAPGQVRCRNPASWLGGDESKSEHLRLHCVFAINR